MDLNPVEVQDLLDINIMQSVQMEKMKKDKIIIENKLFKENIYEDKNIEEFVMMMRSRTLSEIIQKILIASESNDIYQMHHLINLLKEIRFSNNISTLEAEGLLQILHNYVTNNYRDFNFVNDIMSLMIDLVKMKRVNVKLDYRVYYKMFVMFYGISKNEFSNNYYEKFMKNICNLCNFIKSANRLFYFTYEDYTFLKEEINKRLVMQQGQMVVGLLIAYLFLPCEHFKDDESFQQKFLTILENRNEMSNYILLNFSKIINSENGLKIDLNKFIDDVFSISYCSLTDGISQTYFSWPESVNKDKNLTVALCFILANFIIHPQFQNYREKINKNLQILLNLISSLLTENSLSESAFFLVKILLRNIKQLACRTLEYEVNEYDTFKEYEILEQNKERVEEIRKMFYPIVSKSLLYNEPATFSVLLEFLSLSNQKLALDDFNHIINHLFENSQNDYNFFIRKITIFIRCFIENFDDKKINKFLNELIDNSIDKISCVSGHLNNSIMEFYSSIFTLLIHNTNPNLNKLKEKLNKVCVILMKKILNLYSLFANMVEELPYSLFFYNMVEIINPETADEICKMIVNFLKENTIKESKELSFISYFLINFSRKEKITYDLTENIWKFCFDSLVEVQGDSTYKLKEISKDHLFYIKKLIGTLEYFENINIKEYILLIKLLLKEKEEKRKIAFILLKYFVYNLSLPSLRENKIKYVKKEKLQYVLEVYDELIKNYEETISNCIESNKNQERMSLSLNELEEFIYIYLRISISFVLKCNNIFLRDFDYTQKEFNSILNKISEIEIYTRIKEIKNKLIDNSIKFYNFSKQNKMITIKTEKYFRRTFFAILIEYDRYYHMRLISTYRKYLVYYREFKLDEMKFMNKLMGISNFYSHVKLFKLHENHPKLEIVETVLKCYIKTEDKVLKENSLFKTALILQNLKPESKEAYEFFNKMMNLIENKFKKIPITKDNSVTDLRKFNRTFAVFHSLIGLFIAKISDLSLILNTLNKFRLLIDKFKFVTTTALEDLTLLTKLVNYFIPKSNQLLDEKMDKIFNPYLTISKIEYTNEILIKLKNNLNEEINKNLLNLKDRNLQIKTKLKNYINDVLNDNSKFDSANYLDSMNLIVDFITTIKFTLNTYEDHKFLEIIEKTYFNNFLIEEDFLKKRVYLTGFGMIQSLRYKTSKKYSNENNLNDFDHKFNDDKEKRNFNIGYTKYSKIYNNSTIQYLNDQFNNQEGIANFFKTFYDFLKYRENLIALNSNRGIHDKINERIFYLISPQFDDATLIHEREFFDTSYTDQANLFHVNLAEILFYIFYSSGLENYEILFQELEKLKKEDKKDDIIYINLLLMTMSGLIKKEKINKNYKMISEILNRVLENYTNNFNKRIDSEILNLIGNTIRKFTPEETRLLFTDEVLFNYDDLFTMRVINLIHERFEYRSHLVFNSTTVERMKGLINKIMNDPIQWVKNSLTFDIFYSNYLHISRMVISNLDKNYTNEYSDLINEEIRFILEFFRKSQTKESLILLQIIFRETLPYLVDHPDLFVEVVSEFTCYFRIDTKNSKKKIGTIIGLIHRFNKFKEIDYFRISNLIEKKMEIFVLLESFKFCIDIMRKLLIPRLHKIIIGNEIECFNKFSLVVAVAKNHDSRDYFCHYILYLVNHALNESNTMTIINNIYSQIEIHKNEKNNKMVTSLVTVLTSFLMDYEICIEHGTEFVILKLKEINKKLFKNIGNDSQIIKKSISRFYNKYSYTFEFVKRQVSHECHMAILELSKSHSYFI